ncbi:hypothetical protein [Hydrogenophaga sp. 5NK40-0174]|uniref:hypothetical protein n=1 Tax=Hydrogenophaga sp. 5NK40-0174 TaxID=3127649 RepID=UPI0031081FBD
MTDELTLTSAVFTKTAEGQQEIQKRALGLSPLVRRVLVLIDGQRSGEELAAFVGDADIEAILRELLDKHCVEGKAVARKAAPAAAPASADKGDATDSLASLPPASARSANENEMARNFMINTVNTIFGQNARLTLIETIARAEGTDGLRMAFLSWQTSMEGDRAGARRLPELREKLFKVL